MRTLQRRRRRFNIYDRPYVIFNLRSGVQVLLDRHYDPIAERNAIGIGHVVERWRWYDDIESERWLEGPQSGIIYGFKAIDRAACRRWSNEVLRRFLDGLDMALLRFPVKIHDVAGTTYVTANEVKHRAGDFNRQGRDQPKDWPGPWPEGRRQVDPADVPLAPMDRIERRLRRERIRYAMRTQRAPEPTPH
jgi:hypothetical protein